MSVKPYFSQHDRSVKRMPSCIECRTAISGKSQVLAPCPKGYGAYSTRPTAGCVEGKRFS